MKILHTSEFYYPSVGGIQTVVRQISERLVDMGHDVTVATSFHPDRDFGVLNGVSIAQFGVSGSQACGYSGDVDGYIRFLREFQCDVITSFGMQQWATDLAFQSSAEDGTIRTIVPTGFSGIKVPEYKDYYRDIPSILKGYDTCVLLSERTPDAQFIKRYTEAATVVISNGADEREFSIRPQIDLRSRLGIPPHHFLILSVGSHTGVKGHGEAIEIFDRANIRDATLLLVGNSSGDGCTRSCREAAEAFSVSGRRRKDNKILLLKTLTREEAVSAFWDSQLFLFTSNIECSPLVLFECMASGTPFLSTDVGNAREIVEQTGAGCILPTRIDRRGYGHARIGSSIKLLERIRDDVEVRSRMSEIGRDLWLRRFTWRHVAAEYAALYEGLLSSKFRK